MGQIIKAHRNLVGKTEEKILLGRNRSRGKDNFKMDMKEIG
jgi:hypothetical protein